MTSKTSELKVLIDFLRSEGVLTYEQDGIKITLLPQKPQELPPVKRSVFKPGKDAFMGLTEEDQLDLFNEVVSPVSE